MASSPRPSRRASRTRTSSPATQAKPSTRKSPSRGAAKTPTPPAASVAAAQKVLRSVERREALLRTSLERQAKTLKKHEEVPRGAPHQG
jgi:hypothetical protein